MTAEDRYSLAEFAKRYKISQRSVGSLTDKMGLTPETVLTREEFKNLLEDYKRKIKNPPTASPREKNLQKAPLQPKEETVKKGKKTLAQWVREKIARARVGKTAYLKVVMDWEEDTLITESEFDTAVRKHLLNKE